MKAHHFIFVIYLPGIILYITDYHNNSIVCRLPSNLFDMFG